MNEISFDYFPEIAKKMIKSIINAYFGTFRMTRKDAVEMYEVTTGLNKQFFLDKYNISERTWYNYLQDENIQQSIEIDKFLLLL